MVSTRLRLGESGRALWLRSLQSHYLHGSDCENTGHRNLRPSIHLQIPHNEHRKDAQNPITHTTDCGIRIKRIHRQLRIDTVPGNLAS